MAISQVGFTRTEGELQTPLIGDDHISGIIFDVDTPPGSTANGDIFNISSIEDAESIGVLEYDGTSGATNYEFGIPHLHISEFFRVNPGGNLYISFYDASSDWDIIDQMQRTSQGSIKQFGVWTRKKMFDPGALVTDPYTLRLVADLNDKAAALAAINQPANILLSANMVSIDAVGGTTKIDLISSCISNYPYVSALMGQGNSDTVKAIQLDDDTNATVGFIGVALGLVARSSVGDSVAWVDQFDLSGGHMDKISLGFGDITILDGALTNTYAWEDLTPTQIDTLEGKGFIFPIKYTDRAGSYMSSSRTCSSGDYRTIERSRVINKSRRGVRKAMLPFLNSTVKIAPSTGTISSAQTKIYKNAVDNVLLTMQNAGEISGYLTYIDPAQNILETDILNIKYTIVPNGKATNIEITEGYSLTT